MTSVRHGVWWGSAREATLVPRCGLMVRSLGWVVAGMLLSGIACDAQETGRWRPLSKTAQAITGEVAISTDKLTINFLNFTIAQIRRLTAVDTGAVFGTESGAGTGNLYRLNVPAERRFLGRNTLCGSDDTQWMATAVAGKNLQVAFFSGPKMPVFSADVIANSTELCGTYSYVR